MSAWQETFRGVVFPWHCDQFGHMNVRWYAHFFDDAGFALWPKLGIGYKTMEDQGFHTVIGQTTTNFVRELKAGDMVVIQSGFSRVGSKSVTVAQRMTHAENGDLHASQDMIEVFFDPVSRSAIPIPDTFREVLEKNVVSAESV